jgi:hypothetical protein
MKDDIQGLLGVAVDSEKVAATHSDVTNINDDTRNDEDIGIQPNPNAEYDMPNHPMRL